MVTLQRSLSKLDEIDISQKGREKGEKVKRVEIRRVGVDSYA